MEAIADLHGARSFVSRLQYQNMFSINLRRVPESTTSDWTTSRRKAEIWRSRCGARERVPRTFFRESVGLETPMNRRTTKARWKWMRPWKAASKGNYILDGMPMNPYI